MESDLLKEYQKRASQIIARNKSVPDILTKLHVANARIARSVVKAATGCGCISIEGKKSPSGSAKSSLSGCLCEDCGARITAEIGEAFFYAASLCNALGICMEDVLRSDLERTDMMGKYSLR